MSSADQSASGTLSDWTANDGRVIGTGSFVAVPSAFSPAPTGLGGAIKLQFFTEFVGLSQRTDAEGNAIEEPQFNTGVAADWLRMDFRAIDPDSFDPEKVARATVRS